MEPNGKLMRWNDGPVLAYVIGRVALGVNMLIHGAVRLFGDYTGFVSWVEQTFQQTVLPAQFVSGFAYLIPVVEAVVGLCLIVGLLTRSALVSGGLLMTALIFGMGLVQEWSTVADQMIYVLTFYLLLYHWRYNYLSVDTLWE